MWVDAAEKKGNEDEEEWTRYEKFDIAVTKVKGSAPTCKPQE